MLAADSLTRVTHALAACVSPEGAVAAPFAHERRLHARAYEMWSSLLDGRSCPRLADLHSRELADFATGCVLVELAHGDAAPTLHFLGTGLRTEANIASERPRFGDVPRGSLLGQLLRRLPQVAEHGGPVGFEAEFDGGAGIPTTYRGILLPLADDEDRIAYVLGVLSWKLVATDELGIDIVAAVDAAMTAAPADLAPTPWGERKGEAAKPPMLSLAQQLVTARTWAALAETDRARRETSLIAALSAMHDLLIAADSQMAAFAGLTEEAGIARGSLAARTIALVLGTGAPRIERARAAAVLAHARRLGLGMGQLGELLGRYPGGTAAFAAAERRARASAQAMIEAAIGRARADAATPVGKIALKPVDEGYFVLLGRRARAGSEIVAAVPDPERRLTEYALRRFAAG